jgi:hypothetical protein
LDLEAGTLTRFVFDGGMLGVGKEEKEEGTRKVG